MTYIWQDQRRWALDEGRATYIDNVELEVSAYHCEYLTEEDHGPVRVAGLVQSVQEESKSVRARRNSHEKFVGDSMQYHGSNDL